jgi:hypothetical protein
MKNDAILAQLVVPWAQSNGVTGHGLALAHLAEEIGQFADRRAQKQIGFVTPGGYNVRMAVEFIGIGFLTGQLEFNVTITETDSPTENVKVGTVMTVPAAYVESLYLRSRTNPIP